MVSISWVEDVPANLKQAKEWICQSDFDSTASNAHDGHKAGPELCVSALDQFVEDLRTPNSYFIRTVFSHVLECKAGHWFSYVTGSRGIRKGSRFWCRSSCTVSVEKHILCFIHHAISKECNSNHFLLLNLNQTAYTKQPISRLTHPMIWTEEHWDTARANNKNNTAEQNLLVAKQQRTLTCTEEIALYVVTEIFSQVEEKCWTDNKNACSTRWWWSSKNEAGVIKLGRHFLAMADVDECVLEVSAHVVVITICLAAHLFDLVDDLLQCGRCNLKREHKLVSPAWKPILSVSPGNSKFQGA